MPDSCAASAMVAALLGPECYPHTATSIEVVETHISWVFLAGPYAYKVKKPVNLGFVDFSTLDARLHYCEEELRLNRRFAPDLYLNVVEIRGSAEAPRIAGSGPILDYAVRMHRFPQEALANSLLARGELTSQLVTDFATYLAEFHHSLPPLHSAEPYGTPEAVLHNANQNFHQISSLLTEPHDAQALEALRSWNEREFFARSCEMRERYSAGMIRECHGDLHLGNIVLLNGKLVPFDCIEFSAALRWNDVMSEVAFLVMDLIDRGAPRLAWLFLSTYLEATGVYSGLSVLRFYLVYRALVRAKVHLIRARQSAKTAAEASRLLEACRGYMALAEQCSHRGQPRLLLMHGFSASGKSTVAQELVQECGAIRVRADVERKRLHAIPALGRSASAVGSGLYGQDSTDATYTRLADAARTIVQAGYTAVVDAAFLRRAQRAQLREVAAALHVPVAVIDVQVPHAVLRARIATRAAHATDPSEATVEVVEHQIETAEPVTEQEGLPVIVVDSRNGLTPATVMVAGALLLPGAGYTGSSITS